MTTTPFSVSGKTAIVTGGGSGIGLEFVKLLLSRNCNVVLADIGLRPESEEVVSQQTKDARVVFVKTDVTSWPNLRNMFEATIAEFGSFDILCPCAGVFEPNWSNFWHPPGSTESKDDADAGRYASIDINMTHPIRSTQLALQYWLHPASDPESPHPAPEKASPENPKRVILVSSVAAQFPVFMAPIYGACKAAISGFTRALTRLEPETGIRVNAVAPGLVLTPLWTEQPGKIKTVDGENDGWITPADVATAMLDCVESETLIGGKVIEIGYQYTREVKVIGDTGPNLTKGAGIVPSHSLKGVDAVWECLGNTEIWGIPKNPSDQ